MVKFFGFGKKKKEPTPDDALRKLKETEDNVQKKIEFLEDRIKGEVKTALENKEKNKRLALQALRRKKALEEQVKKWIGVLDNITLQINTVENAHANVAVVEALAYSSKALKGMNKNMYLPIFINISKSDVDNVANVIDDIQDERDRANEVFESLATGMGLNSTFDDDELLNELNDLEGMEANEMLEELAKNEAANLVLELPDVPQQKITTVNNVPKKKELLTEGGTSKQKTTDKDLEDELRALTDW